MSQTEDDHWREVPKDRTNPDYPPHLTERFNHINQNDETIIYEDGDNAMNRWIQGVAYNLDSML